VIFTARYSKSTDRSILKLLKERKVQVKDLLNLMSSFFYIKAAYEGKL
jgi:hypothetical protein